MHDVNRGPREQPNRYDEPRDHEGMMGVRRLHLSLDKGDGSMTEAAEWTGQTEHF